MTASPVAPPNPSPLITEEPEPSTPLHGRRWVRRLATIGELLILPFLALCAIRWFRLDDRPRTILIVTFFPWLLLPAYALAALGVFARRGRLIAGALLVVVSHLLWTSAEIPGFGGVSAAAAEAPQLHVMTANVYFGNPNPNDVFDEVLEVDPDVVALQEMNGPLRAQLRDHPLNDAYPHQTSASDFPATMLLSKQPFAETGSIGTTDRRMPWARTEVQGTEVTLLGVHAHTPNKTADWRSDQAELARWSREQEELGNRRIILGDFNATAQHRQFRAVVGTGLRDAHNERGSGWGGTWRQTARFGAMLRIDHILISDGLETTSFRRGRGDGSDHKPLIATIAVLP